MTYRRQRFLCDELVHNALCEGIKASSQGVFHTSNKGKYDNERYIVLWIFLNTIDWARKSHNWCMEE